MIVNTNSNLNYSLFELLFKTENLLNEGIIKTHDINQSINMLMAFCSDEENIEALNDIENYSNKIKLSFSATEIVPFLKLLILINNLGYFPSYITTYKINYMIEESEKFTWKKFKKDKFNEQNIKYLYTRYDLEIEAKHDITAKINSDVVYNVIEERYIEQILNNGLMTKSIYSSNSPERVHLVRTIEDCRIFIKNEMLFYRLNDNFYNTTNLEDEKLILLEIKISNTIFYNDPNFVNQNVLYTYSYINSKQIKIIDKNFK